GLILLMSAEKVQVVQGTTGSRADGLEIHAGGLVAREGEAGAAVGTVEGGKRKKQLRYFIVFKHRLAADGAVEFSGEADAAENLAESKEEVSVDGKTLKIEYRLTLEAKGSPISKETLVLNGKSVDLARGRVLLVDLTAAAIRWEQRKVDLPAEIGATATKKQ